jgi:hypothetical protein
MPLDLSRVRECLKQCNLVDLFTQELGWDHHQSNLRVCVDEVENDLAAVAQKRGMVAYECHVSGDDGLSVYATQRKIERQVGKSVHEHFIVFTDASRETQVWQWVSRETGRPAACREHTYHCAQPGDALNQKLAAIQFALEEEESLTVVDVAGRSRAAFDVDRVTRRFYDRFQKRHAAFPKSIKGIPAKDDRELYRARSDFLHGNPVTAGNLFPSRERKSPGLLHCAPLVCRVAILAFLGAGSAPRPTGSLQSYAEEYFAHSVHQGHSEDALLACQKRGGGTR